MNQQLDFWRGKSGDEYIARNKIEMTARVDLWKRIITTLPELPKSFLEVGANIGQNLMAIDAIIDDVELYAVEPNEKAANLLASRGLMPFDHVRIAPAEHIPFKKESMDCVFTSGVLIHINPDNGDLLKSIKEMFRVAKKYIICIEYFSVEPQMKIYRGEANKLWTRDFGALWLDEFDLRIISYAFEWKRATGLDNLTWWAFEKL